MRIKQEFLDNWLAKLRRGEYNQYCGGLVDYQCANGRCAAGVLINDDDIVPKNDGRLIAYLVKCKDKTILELPDTVLIWNGGLSTISYINDFEHVSFKDIAETLEKNQIDGTFYNVPEEIRAN